MSEQEKKTPRTTSPSAITEEEKRLSQTRQSKIEGFRLKLDLEDEFGAYEAPAAPPAEAPVVATEAADPPAAEEVPALAPIAAVEEERPVAPRAAVSLTEAGAPRTAPAKTTQKKHARSSDTRMAFGCLGSVLYLVGVLAVAGLLSFMLVAGGLDLLGLNKSEEMIDVEIPEGATTEQVATILHEAGLIDQPWIFRVFSRISGADGTYQPGMFTLAGTYGYGGMIEVMQSAAERATVDVTFPEGLTVLEVAQKLHDNGVCDKNEFLWELQNGDFSDYDFISDLQTSEQATQSIYSIEGYLYPDTYTFYVGSTPDTAIRKFLNNFDSRVSTSMRAAIKASGITLDEAIVMASMLQQEADNKVDMTKVARVFWNRLESDSFPHLQSDVTTMYAGQFYADLDENSPIARAYSTYVCEGLPTGAICNPGGDAINAVINPNTSPDILYCYYFATDLNADPTVTYYSETYAQHIAICQRYGIGIHG